MSFFDSKEELINIELTEFGKFLLSKGKFNPKFYAFYDDDVIYDSSYINLNEEQIETQDRIILNTPYSKPQVNFTSVENTALEKNQYLININNSSNLKKKEINYESNIEMEDTVLLPLGNSSQNSIYSPSWNIKFLSGTLSEYKPFMEKTDGILNPYLKIPQLYCSTGSYQLYSYESEEIIPENENTVFITLNLDKSFILTENRDKLINLFEIIENNTDFSKENFQIEVFSEEEKQIPNGDMKKYWKKLFFFQKPISIQNNILLDEPLYSEVAQKIPDTTNVEYYFDLLVDEEIMLPGLMKIQNIVYGEDTQKENEIPSQEICEDKL